MRRNSQLLLVAVTMLVASMALLGCVTETKETGTPTTTTTATTDSTSSSTTTTTTSDGGHAGSGGVAGNGGSGGDPSGGAGSGGIPTGGSGGDPSGGSGGTTTTITITTSSSGGTGGQGGSPGGTGGVGGNPTGGSGGITTTTTSSTSTTTDTTSTTTDTTSSSSTTTTTTDTTTSSTSSTTTTTSDTTSTTSSSTTTTDTGTGGAGGGNQCPAWQAGPGQTCTGFIQLDDPDLMDMNLVWGGQALSETDVFVVGGTYAAGKLVRYNGNEFVPQDIPTVPHLNKVFALGPSEAYAVGQGPKWTYDCVMIELTSGNTWTKVAGTPTLGTNGLCADVWGESSSDLFLLAADGNGVRIFRGPKSGPWTEMAVPSTSDIRNPESVWGSSDHDVYAVGYVSVDGNATSGVLLHYDGNASNEWTEIPLDPRIDWLTSVSGSGPCDVTVGGRAQDSGTSKGVTVHFDGNDWSAPMLYADVNIVSGVSDRAPNELAAAGNTDSPFNEGKFGIDTGNQGLLWDSPLGGYGYLRGLSRPPGSNLVFVFTEANGGGVLVTSCN